MKTDSEGRIIRYCARCGQQMRCDKTGVAMSGNSILEELDALYEAAEIALHAYKQVSKLREAKTALYKAYPTIRSRLLAAERLAAAADQLEQAVWTGELESQSLYCDLCSGTEGDHETDCEAGAVVAALIKWNKAKNE